MRTLIKLLIGLLIVNAAWRVGSAYYQHYAFTDAVQHEAQFAADTSMENTLARVVEIAQTMNVPVREEDVSVRKDHNRVYIDAVYTEQIEVVPTYRVPWEFKVSVTAMLIPRGSVK
jgi:hypothetical protein